MKRKLTQKDILKYLNEINKKLHERNIFGEITICGGAAFALVYKSRNSTHDMNDSVTLMNQMNITDLQQLYNIIEKYNYPMHPKALDETKMFARQVYEEGIRLRNEKNNNTQK